MTCKHDVKRVTIDPSLLADDKDMLEDLVAAAFNDGVRRAEEVSAGEDGQADRRHAAAPGHEVSVLSAAMSVTERALKALIDALRRLPGVGVKSAQRMAFHLLQHDRDGALRLADALQARSQQRAPLRALPHLHRSTRSAAPASTRSRDARQLARGRDAGRPGRAGAHRQLPRPVLRADGAAQSARRRRRARHRRRSSCSSAPPTARCEEVILATSFTAEGEATAHVLGAGAGGARHAR